MKEKSLEVLMDTYKDKSNKDLSNILLVLKMDFHQVKNVILELTVTMEELEVTYETLYAELQSRLKFEDNEK